MKCPVCPAENIPDDAQACPSCGADLKPMLRARELGAAVFNEALALAEAGATDAALSRSLAALALDDRLLAARKLLGKLLWKTGAARAALEQWRQAQAQAPDDEELKRLIAAGRREVGRAARRRTARRTVAVVAAVLVAASLVCLAAMLPSMTAPDSRLDDVVSRIANLETGVAHLGAAVVNVDAGVRACQETIEDTDAEIVALADLGLRGNKAIETLQHNVDTQRAGIEQLVAQLGRTDERIEQLRQAQGKAADDATGAAESAAKAVAALRADLDRLRAALDESQLVLLEAMRPPECEQLLSDILIARQDVAQLCAKETRLERRGLLIIDDLALADVRGKIRQASARLMDLEARCKSLVAPWETAMDRLLTAREERLRSAAQAADERTGDN